MNKILKRTKACFAAALALMVIGLIARVLWEATLFGWHILDVAHFLK